MATMEVGIKIEPKGTPRPRNRCRWTQPAAQLLQARRQVDGEAAHKWQDSTALPAPGARASRSQQTGRPAARWHPQKAWPKPGEGGVATNSKHWVTQTIFSPAETSSSSLGRWRGQPARLLNAANIAGR